MNRGAIMAGPALAVAGAVGVLLLDPFEDRGIGCPLHEATGLWCPGCGATRAVWLLLHGDLAGAVRHNLLLLPAIVVLAIRWLHVAAPARTGWLPAWVRSPTEIGPGLLRAVAVLLVAFTAARNLPALDLLAPPELTTWTSG